MIISKSYIKFQACLIALAFCLTCLYGQESIPSFINKDLDERINLSLRKAGHNLLISLGDTTSSIPPVLKKGDAYDLTLNTFSYTSFPTILDKALADYDISHHYQVLVRGCESDTIKLGYSFKDYHSSNVACQERSTDRNCHKVSITFYATPLPDESSSSIPWPLFTSILIGFVATFYWKKRSFNKNTEDNEKVEIGQYTYHPQKQSLFNGSNEQQLTYRESKLLSLLVNRKNQVVKRETILAEVWEDEGVIVGRSVDVFISRLRKFFSDDSSVQIKNVHGVGYRLIID